MVTRLTSRHVQSEVHESLFERKSFFYSCYPRRESQNISHAARWGYFVNAADATEQHLEDAEDAPEPANKNGPRCGALVELAGDAGEGGETPPPSPRSRPDASMELRRIRELLGGCPISIVVTEAFTASAPWLDGPSHLPPGSGALSLSPLPARGKPVLL